MFVAENLCVFKGLISSVTVSVIYSEIILFKLTFLSVQCYDSLCACVLVHFEARMHGVIYMSFMRAITNLWS